MLPPDTVQPLHLADVTFPEWHPRAGQIGPVNAFLIHHPEGLILVDTGMGSAHPEIDALYRPVRYSLSESLSSVGATATEIRFIINTHLHFDHCGWNSLFPGTPIFVQAAEFEAAQGRHYTIREFFDFSGARYQQLDGQTEVAPGVTTVPTPGHTAGHQSVAIETDEGRIVIAGQAAETAEEFRRMEAESDEGIKSIRLLRGLTPARVYFSHDHAVWQRSTQE